MVDFHAGMVVVVDVVWEANCRQKAVSQSRLKFLTKGKITGLHARLTKPAGTLASNIWDSLALTKL